jgi:putative radical SAM enzyme (TIGR03279 family)
VSSPTVVEVASGSPADLAGVLPHDVIVSISGVVPRDIIEYQLLVEEPSFELEIERSGFTFTLTIEKTAGEPLGIEVSSALFDRVRTCDNHCEFCFIYQLPKGMRRSLYMKDDDYRLSFLYGNFTTLTRFTEADLERVITEKLSPLFVSIHSTNPDLRSEMLRNKRGASSLRWLEAMLEAGIEVHGQIVLCPGLNDGVELERTLAEIAVRYNKLQSVGVVPLGISKYSNEPRMRAMNTFEAQSAIETIERYQELFNLEMGRKMVYASDELYLIADKEFPPLESYDGFPQHENGIGVFRAFEASFFGDNSYAWGRRAGFFASVDGVPKGEYRPYRMPRGRVERTTLRGHKKTAIVTGSYAKPLLERLISDSGIEDVRVIEVVNEFFGGNAKVAGLMTGTDVASVLAREPEGDRYLLPDVCLNEGRFLDGILVRDLPREVEVVPTDGASLAKALAVRRRPELRLGI